MGGGFAAGAGGEDGIGLLLELDHLLHPGLDAGIVTGVLVFNPELFSGAFEGRLALEEGLGQPGHRVDPAAVEAEFPFHLGGELIFMGGEGFDGIQGFRGEEGFPRFGADKA